MKDFITKFNHKTIQILSILFLLLLWQIFAVAIGKEILLPTIPQTASSVIKIFQGNTFFPVAFSTIKRSLLSFFFALAAALVLGIGAGFIPWVYQWLKPVLLLMKSIPTMSIILLAIIWLKNDKAPVLVGFFIVFPILYENIVSGIRHLDPKLLEMARIFRLDKRRMLLHIYLPAVSGFIISGALATAGLNFKIIIAAEVLSQPLYAIGTSMQIAKAYLDTASLFAWSVIGISIAWFWDFCILLIGKKIQLPNELS